MQQTYQRSFILSVILHIFVLIVLATQLNFKSHMPSQAAPSNSQPIKAVAVNQTQVAAQVAKLKAEQQAKQQAELKRQQQLAEQAAAAKRQRELEQQRLAQLKAEALKLQQKRAAEAKAEAEKIAKLKAERAAEQKRLTELAKQQQVMKQKQQQEAKQKQLQEAKQKQKEEAKQKALQQKQIAEQQRKAEEEKLLQQQLAADQQQLEQDKLQAMQSALDKYGDMIRNAIQQQWIVPENMPKNIACKLLIQLGPGGVVLDVKLVQSSGNAILDRSAMAAVRKASPLPVPEDENLFNQMREISLLVRPEGVSGG